MQEKEDKKDVIHKGEHVKTNRTCLKILRYKEEHPIVFYSLVFYLGGLLIYVVIFHIWFADYSKPMPLNEVGDFLAGVFAPIAFLYLYLGYIQQGKELKLQAYELANLVKEQQKQNAIYENQLEIKRIESKPKLDFKNASYTYRIYEDVDNYFERTIFYFHIVNHGNIAKDIIITNKEITRRLHKLETDINTTISFYYSNEIDTELYSFQGKPFSIELDISYCDKSGYQYHNKIKLFTDDFVAGAVDQDFDMRIKELD